ncbi:retropepsin-like aspartic protease family protein [Methylomonas rhizoryzae]|uniref:retropepsin-like aspartic protease family protein n=1 Tax=Methylomonas rhizoryzae TaxID=2608981 RepID=UPI001E5C7DCE|nr:retropepsin-like aspartic protease [Methylomonas rhizoryzae]
MSKPTERAGSWPYLLYPAATLALLWLAADGYLNRVAANAARGETEQALVSVGETTLKIDRYGHFRGTALVNGTPIPFLIDTGATKTVIPAKLASAAHLQYGQYIPANTAGGRILERETHIDSLKIGSLEIRNLDAHINDNLNEALIGMNALRHFRITHDGETMTLSAGEAMETPVQPAAAEPEPRKNLNIRKNVVCDARNVCKTVYSDR